MQHKPYIKQHKLQQNTIHMHIEQMITQLYRDHEKSDCRETSNNETGRTILMSSSFMKLNQNSYLS